MTAEKEKSREASYHEKFIKFMEGLGNSNSSSWRGALKQAMTEAELGVDSTVMEYELEQLFARLLRPKSKIKMMCIDELRSEGYLQEINRKFLHPLGMALAVMYNTDKDKNLIKGSGRVNA